MAVVSQIVLNGVWVAGCTLRKYLEAGRPFSRANAHNILHGTIGSVYIALAIMHPEDYWLAHILYNYVRCQACPG